MVVVVLDVELLDVVVVVLELEVELVDVVEVDVVEVEVVVDVLVVVAPFGQSNPMIVQASDGWPSAVPSSHRTTVVGAFISMQIVAQALGGSGTSTPGLVGSVNMIPRPQAVITATAAVG